jgi:hypothetical protein
MQKPAIGSHSAEAKYILNSLPLILYNFVILKSVSHANFMEENSVWLFKSHPTLIP